MDSFNIRSVVRGFHVYKGVWSPSINEELPTQQEHGNPADPHAVAIMKTGAVVGHVPREISTFCWYFLTRNGTISCTVTERRQRFFLAGRRTGDPLFVQVQRQSKAHRENEVHVL